MSTFWTLPRERILLARYEHDMAAQIATAIGDGCTKNMVIGKAHRMGLDIGAQERSRRQGIAGGVGRSSWRRRRKMPRGLIVVECDGGQ